MRAVAVFVCLVVTAGVAVWAQAPASQTPAQPPQFRASVDLMRVDVTVLDRRTRKPVRGLTAEDFEVRVGGQPQSIQAVAEVETGGRALTGPAWQTTAARDIVTNDISASRLIVIVIDDSTGGAWHRQAGKKVAHAIVDGLAPDDLAAVVFVNRTDRSQDFTADRTLLRAAIEAFDPFVNSRFAAPNAPGTIRNVREFLARVPSYRRAIMVIASRGYGCSGIGPSTCSADPNWYWLRDAGLLDTDPEGTTDDVQAGSRLGHVPIHFFTTIGLEVQMDRSRRESIEDMLTLARVAGGRAIVEHNAPALEVPAVMDELSAMYAIAYRPEFPLDGRLRFADVKVRRDDVIVMPSSGAFRTARERDDEAKRTVTQSRGSGLLHAVTSPLMAGALPLRASVLTVAGAGTKTHPVVLTLGLPTPAVVGASTQFTVRGFVYDGEGRRQLSTFDQQLTVATGAQGHDLAEVVFRLDLAPGRYNFRVAVEQASGQPDVPGPAGSAHLSVAVPDVARVVPLRAGHRPRRRPSHWRPRGPECGAAVCADDGAHVRPDRSGWCIAACLSGGSRPGGRDGHDRDRQHRRRDRCDDADDSRGAVSARCRRGASLRTAAQTTRSRRVSVAHDGRRRETHRTSRRAVHGAVIRRG